MKVKGPPVGSAWALASNFEQRDELQASGLAALLGYTAFAMRLQCVCILNTERRATQPAPTSCPVPVQEKKRASLRIPTLSEHSMTSMTSDSFRPSCRASWPTSKAAQSLAICSDLSAQCISSNFLQISSHRVRRAKSRTSETFSGSSCTTSLGIGLGPRLWALGVGS